ncbi:MAG: SDR family oxidoreductase [Oligoflexia bacterium]|nr:SDR family oxidoreductase [Oligoflexia bacterium]
MSDKNINSKLLLDKKLVLVTGASKGLGAAIASIAAREGADVVITYHNNQTAAEEVKSNILSMLQSDGRLDQNIYTYKLDVRDTKSIFTLAKEMKTAGLIPDILINNAGVSQVSQFPLISEEDYDYLMDTNIKGLFFATQAFVRGMISKKKGKIVNISSLAGVHLIKAPVHYSTSKAAIVGFTMALSKELGPFGITVNGVAPGLLDEGVGINVPENNLKDFVKHNSLGRLGTCQEIAELVVFMASDRNSYMNGFTVLADGGV